MVGSPNPVSSSSSSLMYFSFRKVLLFHLLFFLFTSVLVSSDSDNQIQSQQQFDSRRRLLKLESSEESLSVPKKKSTDLSLKNQTKPIKSNLSTKNQTKIVKPSLLSKNQAKLAKSSNSTKAKMDSLSDTEIKKLNSTKLSKKALNSTKTPSGLSKNKAPKIGSSKNKAPKIGSTKESQAVINKKPNDPETKKAAKNQKPTSKESKTEKPKTTQKPKQPNWIDQEEDNDLVTEFRDLPLRFQQTLIPDLERISITSQKYITKANKQITRGFKPYVGNKYASTIASVASLAFLLIPLILVSFVINRFKAYFSLQKLIIFIQVYLSIYFTILCLSSLVTGLEPLRFFYATSESTYVCVMVLQTLCYVLYLLLLVMYLVLVFSTDCGLGLRLLGLVQTFVGFGIGLHCYVAVFHRVVLHQPPKTNWKIHGVYAVVFLVICLVSNAERRKKTYLEDDGEEGKKN